MSHLTEKPDAIAPVPVWINASASDSENRACDPCAHAWMRADE
jgi:hypothetical protein